MNYPQLNCFLRIKYAIFILASIIFTFQFISCSDDKSNSEFPSRELTVDLKNSDTYTYPTVGGDEEGAEIIVQAKHYEISEIVRNSETNYVAVYTYKPKSDYVGPDYAEIQIETGSDGASEPTEIEIVKFHFNVSE
jgi:hypothetical protein